MKKIIRPAGAPAPVGPYSPAVWAGSTLFCSGQIAIDPTTNAPPSGDVEHQTRVAMTNVGALLAAAGLDFTHVVKATIYLVDMADFAAVNAVYALAFPSDPPARSTVAVAGLPKNARVEIEVIASRD